MKTKEEIEKKLNEINKFIEEHKIQLKDKVNEAIFICANTQKLMLEWVLRDGD